MPIKWKSSQRFKPEIVLTKIDSARTVDPAGGASFSGFDWEECIPALHSMLELPPPAEEIDTSALVWRALTRVQEQLTPSNFLVAANSELSLLLATREEQFRVLTTISVKQSDIPETVSSLGSHIRFLKGAFPKRYEARDRLIKANQTSVPLAPESYTRVIVSLKAKSPAAAFHKAMRSLDLQRAIWCLMGNSQMQITFGTRSLKPINTIRLGGHHTVHCEDGKEAREGIWFEPGYVETKLFGFAKPALVRKNSRWALQRIGLSPYKADIISALVRYVRALDEADANTAFLRLWSAVESLTTPKVADYDKLVRRCAFLFQESLFHKQMLEHLREYRNGSVHAGEHSDDARTLCFQLQLYFNALIWFHIRNSTFFTSLNEANQFLDTPADKSAIKRQISLSKKALNFLR
ncbi:hypothetical protein ACXHWJ_08395 [Alcaligenes nematophilus]